MFSDLIFKAIFALSIRALSFISTLKRYKPSNENLTNETDRQPKPKGRYTIQKYKLNKKNKRKRKKVFNFILHIILSYMSCLSRQHMFDSNNNNHTSHPHNSYQLYKRNNIQEM